MTTARFQSRSAGQLDAGQPKVHVVTFGCQMNKYDSLFVEGRFKRRGWQTTEKLEEADVVLFNTCSVRDHAEERAYSWVGELRRVKEARPELVIGVMGCMAQRVGDEIFARAGHVDLVAGTRQFHLLPELVEQVRLRRADPERARAKEMRVLATDLTTEIDGDRSGEEYTGGRHGYLAVMRGCDLSCTFCIVPKTRGRVASRSIEELMAEARWMVAEGAQVITLLGQTVNSYGEDFEPASAGRPPGRGRQGRTSLADLLHEMQGLDGLERVRLVTLHPSYVTPAFARAMAECDKVDRFLPLPAQSGSDEVLKRMKRGYTVDLYRRRVAILREAVPDIELGSDWIVGFCGESEDDFAQSLALLEEISFAQSYVFQYDPRPGTTAAERLSDDVPAEVKKERHQRLLAAAERVQRARLARHQGRLTRAFIESVGERDARVLLGHTVHGLPCSLQAGAELVGRMVELAVEQTTAFGMACTLAPSRISLEG
jgi:tRNA-2-methylthio-N6-dimethylallyladenosine synthase